MGGRHKKPLSTISAERVGPAPQKKHFGVSSHGENYFPFNPLSFLIHAAQIRVPALSHSWIRCSWLARSTCFWWAHRVLIEDRRLRHQQTCCCEMKEVPTHEEGSLGSGRAWPGWSRQLSMSSCFTTSVWSTHNSLCRKLITNTLACSRSSHLAGSEEILRDFETCVLFLLVDIGLIRL